MGTISRGRRGAARRWIGVLDRTSRPARNPQRLAAGELPARGRAERGILSSLGRAGGVLRALRAADQSLRAGHGGSAGDVAADVLRRQHPRGPLMGARARTAGSAGGIGAAQIWRICSPCRARQALLDAARDRRRLECRAGGLGNPPPAWRGPDRARAAAQERLTRHSLYDRPCWLAGATGGSTRAAHYRLEIIIGLDDLDQAILGRAVAAIGVGMVLLHQRLVFGLDGFERRIGAEPHHLQRLAFGVEYFSGFDLGLSGGAARARPPTAAAVELAEHAERIGRAFEVGLGAALALLGAGIGTPLPGRTMAGN